MFVLIRLLRLYLILAALGRAVLASAETAPFLQLETGGHLAAVKALVFTPDGRFLVSAGDDKVIRIWSTLSGKLVRRISGEMGPGKEGQVYALAVSPDGRWLAAGGWFAKDDDAAPCCGDVRLYDFESGQQMALLEGHTNAVFALAFSPEGQRLVSAGADRVPIVWDLATRAPIAKLMKRGHTDRITAAAFLDSDTVVTGSNDGSVRIWDIASGELKLPPLPYTTRVSGLALARDKRVVFAGYFDGFVHSFDLATGNIIKSWRQSPGGVGSLALSSDGKRLLTTCGKDCGATPAQHIWDVATGTDILVYLGHNGIVEASAISPDAKLAATAGGSEHEIHLWDLETGALRFSLHGQGRTIWAAGVSQDGTRVAWGYASPCTAGEAYCPDRHGTLQFQYELPGSASKLREPEALTERPASFVKAETTANGRAISSRDGPPPQLHHGTILDLKDESGIVKSIERGPADGFIHTAFTFLPDGESFVSGGENGVITAYSAEDGQEFDSFEGSSGAVLALAASPDGKFLVSGGTDQILHIWNVETTELVVSLFVAPDGNWIVWTPQGYYDCSRDADKYIGWYVNRGPNSNSRFVTARELKRHFYRWDIVEDALVIGSAAKAVARADRTEFKLDELLERQPPEFTVASPRDGELISAPNATLVLNVTSDSKGLRTIVLRNNDDPVAIYATRSATVVEENEPVPSGPAPRLEIPLTPGINDISITLSNDVGAIERHLYLRHNGSDMNDGPGNLKVLAIGVNDYGPDAGVRNLKFAVADAEGFADTLGVGAGRTFTQLDRALLISSHDQAVTPTSEGTRDGPTAANIRAALKILTAAKPNDTVVLFIAGHGTRGEDDQYYFLPSDARWAEGNWDPATVISWKEIEDALAATRGHRIVLLDTCRAANSYNRRLMKDGFDESLVIFSATNSKTLAQEQAALGHGVFSYALIEGLRGTADRLPQDGKISITELAAYVTSRVESLTRKAQIPEVEARRLGDLLISAAAE